MADNAIQVSIIIPVYKVEEYIVDCLYSVFQQTYNHLEIILVDDCSPDHSMQIALEKLASEQNRFAYKVIRHSSNKGLSAARNSGVEVATGDYLYFLDSDDEIVENSIAKLVAQVELYPFIDFVIGSIKISGSNFKFPIKSRSYVEGNNEIFEEYVRGKWYVMAWNKLIRRDYFVENNLWFANGMLFEDELFSFQLACTAKRMACIPSETYIYKIRQSGTITTLRQYSRYEKCIEINRLIFDYICRMSPHKPLPLVARFVVNKTYACLKSISKAENLTIGQKKQLCSEQLKYYQSMCFYTQNPEIIIRIKKMILAMPLCFLIYLLKYQCKLMER